MVKLGLAVASMAQHTTDEGWQLFQGLAESGYTLCGYDLPEPEVDTNCLLKRYDPDLCVIQDKREWDCRPSDFREKRAAFVNHQALRDHRCFKATVLKDAHQRPDYHRQAAEEMGIDCHIIYYDERIVREQAAWLGPVVRTWHTVNRSVVPPYEYRHKKAILSGAISSHYPLRRRLAEERFSIADMDYLPHPGYRRGHCHTPSYLQLLSQYQLSICTCSRYRYCLRKIMESTACGCRVITNLPAAYSPPGIEANLFHIDDDITIPQLKDVIATLSRYYDPEQQEYMAEKCLRLYDYRVVTKDLSLALEAAATRKAAPRCEELSPLPKE